MARSSAHWRGEPGAQHRVAHGPGLHGGRDDPRQLLGEADLLGQGGDPALESEQAHRHPPALPLSPDDVLHARACPVEEDLVEVARAGELPDGADLDAAGLVHGHEQEAEAVVAAGVRGGPGEHEAPVGLMGERGPDLLPADPVRRPVPHRRRAHRGEVGTGTGFAVSLTPQFLTGGDRRQEPAFLLLVAVGEEGGGEQVLPDVPGARGRGRAGVLLGPDDLLGKGHGPVAVPRLRPAEPDPAGGAEGPLPGSLAHRAVGVLSQPGPGLDTKGLILLTEPEIHVHHLR